MKAQTLKLYSWIFIMISIIFAVESNAQNWQCGFIPPSQADYLASIPTGNVASGITVERSLPIHFFVVRNTNGVLPGNNTSTGSSSTLMTFIRQELELANQAFGQGSISFYISDIDFIDNPAWFTFDLAQISNIHSAYNDANAINVYLVNTFANAGVGGYAHLPNQSPSNVVFLSVSEGPKYVLAHELGHHFNLVHTFNETFMDGPNNSAAYNGDCATTGDMICDTPPEPVCGTNLSWSCNNPGCSSNPLIVNYLNINYNYNPHRENIMSYNSCLSQSFKPGQIDRMLHALNTHPNRAFLIDNNSPTALVKLPSPTAVATRKNEINQSLENLRQMPVALVREGNTVHSVTPTGTGIINIDVGNFIPGGYSTGRLVPEKNLPLNAGINSTDLAILQNHNININPITTPYRLIAADLNNSGHVSTFDAIWLQKIILGTYTSLQGNTSWRYIPSYTLNDPTFAAQLAQDPFTAIWTGNNEQRGYRLNPASGINKTYFDDLDISLLNTLVDQQNTWSFQAIKVGDLDFSASPFTFRDNGMPELRGDPYDISYNEKECLTKDQLYEIELLGNSKENLYVYQLGAKFDPTQVEIVRCEEDQIKGFNQDNYNPVALKDGELKVVWIDLEKGEKVKFNIKKALFKVVIRPKVNICNLAEAIRLDKQVLPTMFLSERLQDQPMELEWSVKKASKIISGTSGANVFPNPTNNQVSFEIKLDHFQPVEVVLMDVNGRTLSIKQDGYKGFNRIYFSSLNTFDPGLISYRIQLKEQQLNGTFIKF